MIKLLVVATYRCGMQYLFDSLDSQMGRVSMLEGEEECQRDPCSAIQRHSRGSMQLVTTAQEAKIAITTGADLPDNGSETRVSTTHYPTLLTVIAIMYQSRLVIIK